MWPLKFKVKEVQEKFDASQVPEPTMRIRLWLLILICCITTAIVMAFDMDRHNQMIGQFTILAATAVVILLSM